MAKRKDPNQKGSGARKHRRNYRLPMVDKFRREGTTTKYRASHGIPAGRRQDLHRAGKCPVHSR